MSEQEQERTFERILVAVDASRHSLAALQAAAELASTLEAELRGVFVEDVNLLRIAALPMARELRFPFIRHVRMTPGRMRRQLRAQAHQAREAFSSICGRCQVDWTFRVVRGSVSSKILEEAADADLICVGRASRPVMQRPKMGSTARAAVAEVRQPVLVISQDTRITAPVIVIGDGSDESASALLLAGRLALEMGGFLSILVPADSSSSPEELQRRLAERLNSEDMVIQYRELAKSDVTSIIRSVRSEACGILVVSRAALEPEEIGKLLDGVACPVLLMA